MLASDDSSRAAADMKTDEANTLTLFKYKFKPNLGLIIIRKSRSRFLFHF